VAFAVTGAVSLIAMAFWLRAPETLPARSAQGPAVAGATGLLAEGPPRPEVRS
jgi:hypothetical protein